MVQQLGFIFITSFFIALSGALMPGPLLSVTISESTYRGWTIGPRFILGHGLLELLLLAGLFLGLAPILTSKWAFIIIAFAGGAMMIFMGGSMFRSLPDLSFTKDTTVSGGSPLLKGMLLSLANPYWFIWWATIGLGYVLQARDLGIAGVAAFFSGHILADLAWYTFVSLGIHKGRKILPLKVYRGLIAICAGFLIIYASYLIIKGIQAL